MNRRKKRKEFKENKTNNNSLYLNEMSAFFFYSFFNRMEFSIMISFIA